MLTYIVVIVVIVSITDVVSLSGHCLGIVEVSYLFTEVVSHSWSL